MMKWCKLARDLKQKTPKTKGRKTRAELCICMYINYAFIQPRLSSSKVMQYRWQVNGLTTD
jgi:hypothetical protein